MRSGDQWLGSAALTLALLALAAVGAEAQHAAPEHNMRLVAHDDLQARSAHQPAVSMNLQ